MTDHKYSALVKMYENHEISLEELLEQGFSQEFDFDNVVVSYDFNFFHMLIANNIVSLKDCLSLHDENKILKLASDASLLKAASAEDLERLISESSKNHSSVFQALCEHDVTFDRLFTKKFENDISRFVDFLKEHSMLDKLLKRGKVCSRRISSNLKNLVAVLSKVETFSELTALLNNVNCMHEALKNQLVTTSLVEKFDAILRSSDEGKKLRRDGLDSVADLFLNQTSESKHALRILKDSIRFKSASDRDDYVADAQSLFRTLQNVQLLNIGTEQQKYELLADMNRSPEKREALNDLLESETASFIESFDDLVLKLNEHTRSRQL